MGDAIIVYWKDHYSLAGWHTIDNIGPSGHVNVSIGFLFPQEGSNDYLTLAQTVYEDGSTVADVLYILRTDVIKVIELDENAIN